MSLFGKAFFKSKNIDTEGAYSTGVFCLQNNDVYGANDYFKQAASEGHISALYNLALMNGGGSISPCDIDFAVDCFRRAAAGEHPNAKGLSFWLDKADDTSFGTTALSMFASKLPPDEPNHLLMMVGCRLYSALCQRYEATDGVIKYELDAASKSDYPFIQEFVKRTGLSKSFYDGGLDMLTEGSAADQITDGLNSLYFALVNSGHNEAHCLFIRCTIVGYIISQSKYSGLSKPLLGIDKFFI